MFVVSVLPMPRDHRVSAPRYFRAFQFRPPGRNRVDGVAVLVAEAGVTVVLTFGR
jgi:hypothetical protein